jgi:hypothetical protein
MQHGSLALVSRKEGPAVWQFRWSEKDLHGARVQRKRVIGTVERYLDEARARSAIDSDKARMGSRLRSRSSAIISSNGNSQETTHGVVTRPRRRTRRT